MLRRIAGVLALVVSISVLASAGWAAAQGCSGPNCGAPPADVDAGGLPVPGDSSQPLRESPFAVANSPSVLPVVSVAAGLFLLGATLARVALRRRATLRAGIESDVEAETVVRVRSSARASGIPTEAPAPVPATGQIR